MFKLYSEYLKPYRGKVAFVLCATMISTFLGLVLPSLSKRIIDEGAINRDEKLILQTMIIMLVVSVLIIVITISNNYVSSKLSMGFARDLRKSFFRHVSELSQGDINHLGSSSLISRQTNDIMQLQTILVQMLQFILSAPILVIGGIIMAVLNAPSMSWTLLITLPIAVIILVVIMRKISSIYQQIQIKLDGVNRIIRENLNGMRVIRAFNRESFEEQHFGKENEEYRQLAEKSGKMMFSMSPLITVIVNIVNLMVIYFGARYMDNGSISYGSIQAFVQYVSMILTAFMLCGMLLVILPRGKASAERVNEVFNVTPSVTDPEQPVTIPAETESSIAFDHVSFSYPKAETPVLSDITFSAKKGETLAIIGGTGSGKSTLLNLITRDYDVTSGSVQLNGVDVRKLRTKDLHDRLAVVPQKAFLFAGSIFDNVRYGKADATVEEVEHALEVSQSKEFVDQKEYGMYSYITQAGSNVSGGQRQRLAIARALVRHPDVYLFDDSFSALDFKTDAKIRKLLKQEVKDSVMVIVAQRVSTIKEADKIIVLDTGKIAGIGTHDELMQSCEIYREIALSQTSEKKEG